MKNNSVRIVGTICSKFEYSHTVCGEKIYLSYVSFRRSSGAEDILPVHVSERLLAHQGDMLGQRVEIEGSFRNYNYRTKDARRGTTLYIFADLFRLTTVEEDSNDIVIEGYICRPPVYRKTTSGRSITDTTIVVYRDAVKTSDYLPLIAWARNAGYVAGLEVGDRIKAYGRIQSRAYRKMLDADTYEDKIAYEISVYWIDYHEAEDNEAQEA